MQPLSTKELEIIDAVAVYEICKNNTAYYKHMNEIPSLEGIEHTFLSLPAGVCIHQKSNYGLFLDDELVAFLEMVRGYPDESCAMLGFFVVKLQHQRQGYGARIVDEIVTKLKVEGYSELLLSCSSSDSAARSFGAG